MEISITRASLEEKPVVARLLQLCLHDYSAHDRFGIGDDGLFGYRWSDLYWSNPHRHPYLFRVEGRLAGFAFVRQREEDEPGDWRWQIAEFFILRGLRRKRIGMVAASALLRSRCGVWEFAYDLSNEPARLFWRQVARSFNGGHTPIAVGTVRECYHVTIEPEEANKAPEPTTMAVTPRATSRISK